MVALIVVVMLALGGGGVSFAAESSVPGDALYVVKTSVNEPVRGAIAMGAEADAKWEAELAVRRLDEAAKLEASGKLSAETETKLNDEFSSHVEAAFAAAKNAASPTEVEAEVRTRLGGALDAQAEVIAPRDVATGQATGKRAFTVPHVLELELNHEVTSPRDTASGQASGINVAAGDVTGDGKAEVTTGATTDTDSDGAAGAKADASASLQLKAGYDVKSMSK